LIRFKKRGGFAFFDACLPSGRQSTAHSFPIYEMGCDTKFFQTLISPPRCRIKMYNGAYIPLTVPLINTPLQWGVGAAGTAKTVSTVLSSRHFNP
jgi:hypothetical protein